MPGYNRTGPLGAGPETGRGRGNCMQRSAMSRSGRAGEKGGMFSAGRLREGFGRRCSEPRGWWRDFQGNPASAAEEVEALKANLSAAKEEIAVMEARLAELEKKE